MTGTKDPGDDESLHDDLATSKTAEKKKPYVKPSFRYEKVFVTTALSCGKVSNTEANCVHNTKAS